MKYASASHRRARAVGRYARYAALSVERPGSLTYVPTYWWDQRRNFGDQLTPTLLPSLGIAPIHQPPRNAALVGVGSVLEHLPSDYSGAIWGSGLIFNRSIRLPNADVLAVRGKLTADHLGLPDTIATGDPGLLLMATASASPTKAPVLIPHYRHQGHALWARLRSQLGPKTGWVDVRSRPSKVASVVANASLVITSSLHGLITADANGIPAVWILPAPWGDGGAFKFLDYESNFGWSWERFASSDAGSGVLTAQARAADADKVEQLRRGLVESLYSMTSDGQWRASATSVIGAVKMQRQRTWCGSLGNQWPSDGGPTVPPQGGETWSSWEEA